MFGCLSGFFYPTLDLFDEQEPCLYPPRKSSGFALRSLLPMPSAWWIRAQGSVLVPHRKLRRAYADRVCDQTYRSTVSFVVTTRIPATILGAYHCFLACAVTKTVHSQRYVQHSVWLPVVARTFLIWAFLYRKWERRWRQAQITQTIMTHIL